MSGDGAFHWLMLVNLLTCSQSSIRVENNCVKTADHVRIRTRLSSAPAGSTSMVRTVKVSNPKCHFRHQRFVIKARVSNKSDLHFYYIENTLRAQRKSWPKRNE